MRLTLLSALLPCLACVRPHDDAGAPDLTKGTAQDCTKKVQEAALYSLCFVSGGLNPKKEGDKDHYEDAAWKAVQTGGEFHKELSEMKCGYCPAIGYWPPFAEKSIMIYCPTSREALGKKLFVHCVKSGVALVQDAVLYRGEGTHDIHVISTYKDSGELKPEDIDEAQDADLLKIGVFGKADKATEGMGTNFIDEEAPAGEDLTAMVREDDLFAFKADFNSRAFCQNCKLITLGSFFQMMCVLPGTGVDNNGLSGGRMCNELCAACKDMRMCCPKVDLAEKK